LKQSNIELSQQLASSDVLGPHPRSPLRQMPIPSQPAALKGSAKVTALPASPSQLKPSGQQNSFGDGQAKADGQHGPAACEVELKCEMGQGEMRLQVSHCRVKHPPHFIAGPGWRGCVHLGMPCCPASIPLMLMVDALLHNARTGAVVVTLAALQSLRKQLKRSAAQCEALKAEVAELKRRDRTADLYQKKVGRKPCHMS